MSELRELYQSVILDHNKRPRNFGAPADANRHAQGHNPLCGDRLSVHVLLEEGVVKDVGFEGQGCAISKASASLMTTPGTIVPLPDNPDGRVTIRVSGAEIGKGLLLMVDGRAAVRVESLWTVLKNEGLSG
jgi:hypothetical protein